MRIKSSLLSGVAVGVLFAAGAGVAAQAQTTTTEAPAKKPVHKKAAHAPVANQTQQQIDELRQQVQFLKDRLDEQATVNSQSQVQLQQAQAAAAAAQAQATATAQAAQAQIQTIPAQVETAVAANKPKDDKLYYKGVSITFGGFAEAAGIFRSRAETADISSSFAKIPFNNDPASHTGELRGTARQSRYSALVQGDIDENTHAIFYGEFDFQAGAQTANSNQSDSYSPRIRNLYGEMDWDASGWHLLAGQNWSLVTLNTKGITPRNEAPPPSIDAQYVPGFAWARQPQIRVTHDFMDKQLWVALSAENPQTTLSLNGGTSGVASGVSVTDNQAPTNGYFSGTNYSLNKYPDVVAKIAYEPKIGNHTLHLEALAIGRSYYDHVVITPTGANQAGMLGLHAENGNQTTFGGGVGGSAAFDLVPKYLDLQGSVLAGSGIGRYGSAGLPDVTASADGKLQAIPETMWLAGATLHPVKQLDVYVFGGGEDEASKTYHYNLASALNTGYGTLPGSNNSGCSTIGGTCSPLTKSVQQITAGFWDRIYQGSFGRIQVGVQYSYTERQSFSDAGGLAPKAIDNMVFTSFRYYPF
jgi:hypothetical protein